MSRWPIFGNVLFVSFKNVQNFETSSPKVFEINKQQKKQLTFFRSLGLPSNFIKIFGCCEQHNKNCSIFIILVLFKLDCIEETVCVQDNPYSFFVLCITQVNGSASFAKYREIYCNQSDKYSTFEHVVVFSIKFEYN